jgi:hypothetical protein
VGRIFPKTFRLMSFQQWRSKLKSIPRATIFYSKKRRPIMPVWIFSCSATTPAFLGNDWRKNRKFCET